MGVLYGRAADLAKRVLDAEKDLRDDLRDLRSARREYAHWCRVADGYRRDVASFVKDVKQSKRRLAKLVSEKRRALAARSAETRRKKKEWSI